MEDNENKIYFIYCQKGSKNKAAKIEGKQIYKVDKIKEGKIDDEFLYALYCIILKPDFKEKSFTLTLIDINTKLNNKTIYLKNGEKFKYEMIFESLNGENKNPLNQKTLNYKEQFKIFKDNLGNNIGTLNDLFLNSIDVLSEKKTEEINYSFLLFVFLEIYIKYKDENDDLIKNTIKKYFEKLNFKLLEIEKNDDDEGNSEQDISDSLPALGIDSNDLEIIDNSDTYKLRNELIYITGDKKEINIKIDVFLAYYYIFYKPKLFINFIDTQKDKFEEIKSHLLLHKKLFHEFNSTIIGPRLEYEDLDQIKGLIKNFLPNILDFLKLLSNQVFYL